MPQRWCIRLAIRDDSRFLSHHDTMRAVDRTMARAKLPLRFTRGFNPHPIFSLVCPRPVGVATLDDVLVVKLDDVPSGAPDGPEILRRLNAAAPQGLRFLDARTLEGKATPQPGRADYELPLDPPRAERVRERLEQLGREQAWPVERRVSARRGGRGRRGPMRTRTIDLRPLVEQPRAEGPMLRWTFVRCGDAWARPSELLRLLALDERTDLARVVRTTVALRDDAPVSRPEGKRDNS